MTPFTKNNHELMEAVTSSKKKITIFLSDLTIFRHFQNRFSKQNTYSTTTNINSEVTNLNLSLPEPIMETCSVVLTFESVDKILRCDHSNETSLAVLLHGTICFAIFYKMKLGTFFKL